MFTRMGHGQSHYARIDGVHYHRCPFDLHSNFVDEINNMCRSFVHHVFQTEDYIGAFDIIHAHDWLTSNAMIWMKQGRGRQERSDPAFDRIWPLWKPFLERSVCANPRPGTGSYLLGGPVIAVSNHLRDEIMWMYEVPHWKVSIDLQWRQRTKLRRWDRPWDVKRGYSMGPMDPTVLFSGRMVYQKGPDLLVEAIPAILNYYPNASSCSPGMGKCDGKRSIAHSV